MPAPSGSHSNKYKGKGGQELTRLSDLRTQEREKTIEEDLRREMNQMATETFRKMANDLSGKIMEKHAIEYMVWIATERLLVRCYFNEEI